MTFVVEPFVGDLSTSTGIGNFTVANTPPFGQRTLSAVLSPSPAADQFNYSIQHKTAYEFEEGIGTYVSANVFERTTVKKSSSANALVNFSAGTKSVALVHPSFSNIVEDIIATKRGAVGSAAKFGIITTAPGGQEEEENFRNASFMVNDYVHANPIFGGVGLGGYFGIKAEGAAGVGVNSFAGLEVSVCGNVENIGDFNGGLYLSSVGGINFSNTVSVNNWYYYGQYISLYDYGNLALPCRSNYTDFIGLVVEAQHRGTGTATNVIGAQIIAGSGQSGGTTGACTNLVGLDIVKSGTYQSITNAYGVRIQDHSAIGASAKNYNFLSEGANSLNIFEGKIILGGTAAVASSKLQVLGTSVAASISLNRYQNAAFGPVISLSLSRSGVVGTETIVQSGDGLGFLQGYGSDGTQVILAGEMRFEVDGTPGVNDMPGRIVFATTPDGAAAVIERLRIDSTGLATFTAPVKTMSSLVSALPSASTSGAGARAFATDSNLTTAAGIGTVIVGTGGSPVGNKVPVYSDGTNWLIG